MESVSIPLGGLVQHARRPGVWRVISVDAGEAVIEPWDDLAAGYFHAAEAYAVRSPIALLHRLRPGRAEGMLASVV